MKVFWIAGESSGDRHSAELIRALQQASPGTTHSGMCGEAMRSAGCEPVADISEASVMGLTEVIRDLPRLIRLRNRLVREIVDHRPDLLILVDFPDFNLSVLSRVRRLLGREIRIMYFISPQVWAWRRGRVKFMAKQLDAMAVLFPFEVEFYRRYGLETVFFGHPFVGKVAPSAEVDDLRQRFGLTGDREAVALMPGSRAGEIRRHLPVMLRAVERLRRNHPNLQALVIPANSVGRATLRSAFNGRDWIRISDASSADTLAVSRVALIKSGTSTVEAALVGTPFAVLYVVSPLTYLVARTMIRGVKHIAMVNVLAGREVVSEFIQGRATEKAMARNLEQLWEGPQRDRVIHGLAKIRDLLGEPGGMERLAEWIVRRFGGDDG